MDATDKGFHWECEKGSMKLEFGENIFFIPDLVAKNSKDVFVSLEPAVASLMRLIERDVTGAQKMIQGLYGQLSVLKGLHRVAASDTIEQ